MLNLQDLTTLLSEKLILISDNIINDIFVYMTNSTFKFNHITFLIDSVDNKILTYNFNNCLRSYQNNIHSEVNTINKYLKFKKMNELYKNKKLKNNKKMMIILKISKTGKIGTSKPCMQCAHYIYLNYNKINLNNIYFSNKNRKLEELKKNKLIYSSKYE